MARTRAGRRSTNNDEIATNRVPRSAFDRSYNHKTTMDSGYLYPLHWDEVLPGDTINFRPSFLVRLTSALQRPYMDGLYFDWQAFFIPARLVWDNFVKMMGERVDPGDHNDYTLPQMSPPSGGHLVGSLSDYLGIPTEVEIDHMSLLHRSYNLVWNTWYRDADIQDSVVVDLDDGPDNTTDYELLKRGKRKDYLSGCRPFAQRGDAVELPLGSSAPVTISADSTGYPTFDSSGGGTDIQLQYTTGSPERVFGTGLSSGDLSWGDPHLEGTADLTSATAATINTIRQAIATQHLLEADARGGGRYWEVVFSSFRVTPDHIQLDRPQLLCTGSMEIGVQVVPQTSKTDVLQATGDLKAYGVSAQTGRGFVSTFREHGFILMLCSVRAELGYQQGLHRAFSRQTRFDHYWPQFAALGEQAVLSKEIYADGTASDDDVWGYAPRYEEYRHRNNMITGQLRSTFATSLDTWHLGLDFASRPTLNAAFIEEDPPVDRVVALITYPHFLVDMYVKQTHVRPMPRFATPGLVRF